MEGRLNGKVKQQHMKHKRHSADGLKPPTHLEVNFVSDRSSESLGDAEGSSTTTTPPTSESDEGDLISGMLSKSVKTASEKTAHNTRSYSRHTRSKHRRKVHKTPSQHNFDINTKISKPRGRPLRASTISLSSEHDYGDKKQTFIQYAEWKKIRDTQKDSDSECDKKKTVVSAGDTNTLGNTNPKLKKLKKGLSSRHSLSGAIANKKLKELKDESSDSNKGDERTSKKRFKVKFKSTFHRKKQMLTGVFSKGDDESEKDMNAGLSDSETDGKKSKKTKTKKIKKKNASHEQTEKEIERKDSGIETPPVAKPVTTLQKISTSISSPNFEHGKVLQRTKPKYNDESVTTPDPKKKEVVIIEERDSTGDDKTEGSSFSKSTIITFREGDVLKTLEELADFATDGDVTIDGQLDDSIVY